MGDILLYLTKEQLDQLENIKRYRLLYLYELVTFLQNLDKNPMNWELDQVLETLPLVTDNHYKQILNSLLLPDDILDT